MTRISNRKHRSRGREKDRVAFPMIEYHIVYVRNTETERCRDRKIEINKGSLCALILYIESLSLFWISEPFIHRIQKPNLCFTSPMPHGIPQCIMSHFKNFVCL